MSTRELRNLYFRCEAEPKSTAQGVDWSLGTGFLGDLLVHSLNKYNLSTQRNRQVPKKASSGRKEVTEPN